MLQDNDDSLNDQVDSAESNESETSSEKNEPTGPNVICQDSVVVDGWIYVFQIID